MHLWLFAHVSGIPPAKECPDIAIWEADNNASKEYRFLAMAASDILYFILPFPRRIPMVL
jgi:hypothetical protein